MRRHRIPILLTLTLGILSGCSAYPPKVSCERHLTPINVAPRLPPAAAAPRGAARAASKDPRPGSSTHGR